MSRILQELLCVGYARHGRLGEYPRITVEWRSGRKYSPSFHSASQEGAASAEGEPLTASRGGCWVHVRNIPIPDITGWEENDNHR